MPGRSALRADSTALLGLASRRELASFAALTTLKHARRVRCGCALARADASPALLAAPEIAPTRPHRVPPAAPHGR